MSNPKNPLLQLDTFQTQHVLAAFKTTSSAENTPLTNTSGNAGDAVGDGFIITNEFTDATFTIPTISWAWNRGNKTTSMTGTIKIADAVGGRFIDWFKTNIIPKMGVSAQHMTFALKTYFMGVDRDTEAYQIYTGNPLIFHVHEFEDMMNADNSMAQTGTTVAMHFTGAYNSTGQRVNFKPYQMTLTHKDGNLNNSDPQIFAPSGGIDFRGNEDATKTGPRLQRLEKSKPMKNLKDLFDAFEVELNQQQYAHKRQVQKWLKDIRDGYEYKIDPEPNQQRGEKLPVKFEVQLDEIYNSYEIDNRNLPFEQTDEDKNVSGVTSVPLRAGATLVEMVSYLMKFSRKVGDDAALTPPKSFKINISYIKESNQLKLVIKIKQIDVAVTTTSIDTGPGVASQPLNYTFKAGERTDVDITYLKTSITTDNGIKTLERGPRVAVLGNREPVMGESIPDTAPGTNFFDSEFSGLRTSVIPYLNGGLEDGVAGANADIMQTLENSQTSAHEIQIYGNPDLMFDLYRKPSEAASLNSPGDFRYYEMPESYPMYLTIDIFLDSDAQIGLNPSTTTNPKYYYRNHYEIVGVSNIMVESRFYQRIQLAKRDDII
jgi:hypothetical protein